MNKKLHIELTKFGLYIYVDDTNRGTKLSHADIADDCNVIDEEDLKKLVNGFSSKGKVYTFDLDRLLEDANNAAEQRKSQKNKK